MCKDVRKGYFWNMQSMYINGGYLGKSIICVKREHNISHLPLSLTVGVHPPWVFADRQIPAVIIARITPTQQLTQAR